eukprot:734358-Amphidinium_carterae.1
MTKFKTGTQDFIELMFGNSGTILSPLGGFLGSFGNWGSVCLQLLNTCPHTIVQFVMMYMICFMAASTVASHAIYSEWRAHENLTHCIDL